VAVLLTGWVLLIAPAPVITIAVWVGHHSTTIHLWYWDTSNIRGKKSMVNRGNLDFY